MIHDHCVACGQSDNLNQHHLVPRSLGGTDATDNLLTLCGSCHAKAHQVKATWKHSELTRKAMRNKQANEEYIGGNTPYGFGLINGNLIKNLHEQEVIQKAKDFHATGLSLRKIAAELDKLGIKTRKDSIFAANQIKRMVA